MTGLSCEKKGQAIDERKDISMRAIVLVATVVAVLSLCCSERGRAGDPVNPNLSAEGRQILDYLESTYQKQVCLPR